MRGRQGQLGNPPTDAAPRQAALRAAAEGPAAAPITGLVMNSAGRLLIVGEAGVSLGWAEKLHDKLDTTVLIDAVGDDPQAPASERYARLSGKALSLDGHLGAFRLRWRRDDSLPEAEDGFDLVLDLSEPPLLRALELPDGYQAPGREPLAQALAVIELLPLIGEFEKPQYVALNPQLCAHSRAKLPGCDNCLSVCAADAILAAGDAVRVDPYLCRGCGACATVCPSGALSYQYPRVADLGARLRAMLLAYAEAGGEDACLLFHSATAGRQLLARLQGGAGLPPRVLPVETWSAEAVGLDLMLAALALGANQVAVLAAGCHDTAPLRRQVHSGEQILAGLGYGGEHLRIIDAQDEQALVVSLAAWAPAVGVGRAASFCPHSDKRATLDLAIAHLREQAENPPQLIALAAGAPFGSVAASEACTLCMGCVGACPAGALVGGSDAPRLSFIEHNCLQCGLCVASCPEQALSLTPRLLLEGARRERLLRQAEIFRCTRCGKPMGARPLIEAMVSRLAGHSMFATEAARARLSMCGDCRVVDLVRNEDSVQASEMAP